MRHVRSGIALLTALLALACGPFVMLPGGELSGSVEPPPSDWSFTDDVEIVQLETDPSDPYSVNIWGAGMGDGFYIASGRGAEAAWVENIEADPDVRLRVGESIYLLRATRVDSEDERERFLTAMHRKYNFTPDPEQQEEALLFRLDPR